MKPEDEQKMVWAALGSLFDKRVCEVLQEIQVCLDEADALIQKGATADQARIRISAARNMARATYVMLKPEEDPEIKLEVETLPPAQGLIDRAKQAGKKFI
jgi:predicted transcriptional regulator